MELDREGKSYTADTLRAIRAQYPNAQLWLLMGTDMFLTLHLWHDPEVITQLAGICAFGRTEQDGEELFAPPEGVPLPEVSGPDRHHHPAGTGGCVLYPAAGAAGPGEGQEYLLPPGVRLYPDEPAVRHPRGPEAAGASGAAGLFLLHDPGQAGPTCYGRGGRRRCAWPSGGAETRGWPAGPLSSTTAPSIWNWTTSSACAGSTGVELDELEQQAVKLLHAKTGGLYRSGHFWGT